MFNCNQDVATVKKMDAEAFKLYYKPRVWLVHNNLITTNIYGEPGDPLTGSDGATSVPANRIFTSTGSDFVASGVVANCILELNDLEYSDNGRYKVVSVTDATHLVVDSDWPTGSLSSLDFRILYENEKYTAHTTPIPFHIKLDPSQWTLKKWGIEQKEQPIDALIKMSISVCEEYGLTPKIGDRFNYPYGALAQQYEVFSIIERDQVTDTGTPIHYVGTASKTRDVY